VRGRLSDDLIAEAGLLDAYKKLEKDENPNQETKLKLEQQLGTYADSDACDQKTIALSQAIHDWAASLKTIDADTEAQLLFWNRYLYLRIENTARILIQARRNADLLESIARLYGKEKTQREIRIHFRTDLGFVMTLPNKEVRKRAFEATRAAMQAVNLSRKLLHLPKDAGAAAMEE
jgi:hypothetical protein